MKRYWVLIHKNPHDVYPPIKAVYVFETCKECSAAWRKLSEKLAKGETCHIMESSLF